MLKTRYLSFSYNQSVQFRFPDIELGTGEDLLILGESGIGKTTLLHLIAGLLKPNSGSVEFMSTTLNLLPTKSLDRFRGKHMGLIFQRPHFIQSLSLQDNLGLVQYLAGKRKDSKKAVELLELLGIAQKARDRFTHLSQGEQQRAAIALALINRPELILADEPTSSLDDKNCFRVMELLKEQALSWGASLMIITHDQRLKDQFQNTISL